MPGQNCIENDGQWNPCKCGYYPDQSKCSCTKAQIDAYLSKISGPLLDRIDLTAEASPISYRQLRGLKKSGRKKEESTEQIRNRVIEAVERQKKRYIGTGIRFNSELTGNERKVYRALDLYPRDLNEIVRTGKIPLTDAMEALSPSPKVRRSFMRSMVYPWIQIAGLTENRIRFIVVESGEEAGKSHVTVTVHQQRRGSNLS